MRGFLAALGMTLAAAAASAQTGAEQLIQRELASSQAYETLAHLTDDIGQRLSGSPGAAAAVRFTTERFRAWGIDVRNERVAVPHWVRGREEARLVSQHDQKIVLTAVAFNIFNFDNIQYAGSTVTNYCAAPVPLDCGFSAPTNPNFLSLRDKNPSSSRLGQYLLNNNPGPPRQVQLGVRFQF